MMNRTFCCFLLLLSSQLYSQKEVKTYYDPAKKQVQEQYFVSADNQSIEGKYKKFFPNGKIYIEGTFVNGVRSGTFYEYHQNGNLIRKISYEDGLR
ncbi:MAG: toxin-antitoxin system YwqK family antitoxin, partial [Cyclobacteriaceae bacterium]